MVLILLTPSMVYAFKGCVYSMTDLEKSCTNSDSNLTLLNSKVISQRVKISTVIWKIVILLLSKSTVNEKVKIEV